MSSLHPIYLDYNATTPIDREVLEAMQPFLHHQFWNPSSAHAQAQWVKKAIENARTQVATLLNAQTPEEVVFTSGGTESNNMALLGASIHSNRVKRHIISSTIEHPSVSNICRHLKHTGHQVSYVPVDSKGILNLQELSLTLTEREPLISIMLANNEVGTIQPLQQVVELATPYHAIVHTDASQAVGKVPCDVQLLGVDMLSLAGHKLYAPKGIGALYIKNGTPLENLLHGASQEQNRRPGTENTAYIAGLGKACELARQQLETEAKRLRKLTQQLYKGLKNLFPNDLVHHGDQQNKLPNTLNISIKGIQGNLLLNTVQQKVIFSTGSACHANAKEISGVLRAMGVSMETGAEAIRISIGKYTTSEEIEAAMKCIYNAVQTIKAR